MADELDTLDLTPEMEDVIEEQDDVEDDILLDDEEESPESDDPTMRKVRGVANDALRRAAVAERRAAQLESERDSGPIEVGAFPDLEDPGIDWDQDRLRVEQEKWHERNNAAKARAASQVKTAADRDRTIRDLDVSYRTSATRLGPKSTEVFEEADKEFRELFGEEAPIALAGLFKDPAKIVVALHKYPARREAILNEPDTTKRLLLIKEIEMALKAPAVRKATARPETESIQTSASSVRRPVDKQAAKLLAEAGASGDIDKYRAWKKSQKPKAA